LKATQPSGWFPEAFKLGASLFAVPHPDINVACTIIIAVPRALNALALINRISAFTKLFSAQKTRIMISNFLRVKLGTLIIFPLPVTDNAFFIIGPAVTLVATARVHLAVDLVQGQIIPAVYQFAVRPVAEPDRRLHLKFNGMAIVAEGAFMAGSAELCFPCRVQAMVFYEILGMIE
jgi:hypothetical protein